MDSRRKILTSIGRFKIKNISNVLSISFKIFLARCMCLKYMVIDVIDWVINFKETDSNKFVFDIHANFEKKISYERDKITKTFEKITKKYFQIYTHSLYIIKKGIYWWSNYNHKISYTTLRWIKISCDAA